MPTFLSFVLTDSEGCKMYAITVTFYEEMPEDMIEVAKRSTREAFVSFFFFKPSDTFIFKVFMCELRFCVFYGLAKSQVFFLYGFLGAIKK